MNAPLFPDPSPLAASDAMDLTRAILARTSGSPCERLRAQACAFVDGELEPARGALVRAHLEHCPACASLVAALVDLQTVLPAMAAVDPGPWFTQRVLRATVHAPLPDARALWSRLMHRPRICLEAAYLGLASGMLGMVALPPLHLPDLLLPVVGQIRSAGRSMEPVKAPFQRVGGQVCKAGQRTQASLARCLKAAPVSQRTPLQRLSAWFGSWFKELRAFLPPRGKDAKPANP